MIYRYIPRYIHCQKPNCFACSKRTHTDNVKCPCRFPFSVKANDSIIKLLESVLKYGSVVK